MHFLKTSGELNEQIIYRHESKIIDIFLYKNKRNFASDQFNRIQIISINDQKLYRCAFFLIYAIQELSICIMTPKEMCIIM